MDGGPLLDGTPSGPKPLDMCTHISRPMPNITLAVPEELLRKMKSHPEVKWSEVVRRVIAARIRDLERMDRLARRSTLTGGDIDELDHLIKEGLRRRHERARRAAGE